MQQQQDLLILGTALQEAREQHGLSTSNLAAATGLTPAHIKALEDGQLDPDFKLLLQLAKGMGTHPSAFFLRAEELDNQGTERRAGHE